mmetsp:Transcript_117266/g.378442  ORF Transcript_117266/g.378442 Transcript_117266/m.378442 type:complete len:291 (+) Transcript_117266:620-1492(+)
MLASSKTNKQLQWGSQASLAAASAELLWRCSQDAAAPPTAPVAASAVWTFCGLSPSCSLELAGTGSPLNGSCATLPARSWAPGLLLEARHGGSRARTPPASSKEDGPSTRKASLRGRPRASERLASKGARAAPAPTPVCTIEMQAPVRAPAGLRWPAAVRAPCSAFMLTRMVSVVLQMLTKPVKPALSISARTKRPKLGGVKGTKKPAPPWRTMASASNMCPSRRRKLTQDAHRASQHVSRLSSAVPAAKEARRPTVALADGEAARAAVSRCNKVANSSRHGATRDAVRA